MEASQHSPPAADGDLAVHRPARTEEVESPSTLSGSSEPFEGHGNHGTDAPPFWSRHGRSVSNVSYQSIPSSKPQPISLEDHSDERHELSASCWAQSATIDDFVVISGLTGIGAYVVWHCTVDTLKGGKINLRKRLVGT